jgi:conjugative relaxase-like TrwC/TraI family protein
MLTISNVANSSAAGNYYEKIDDYYSRDRSPSLWSGKGAEVLGLTGPIDSKAFRFLLDGELPGGINIHHGGENGGRRGGTDLTFSAPKSVSMQALIGGDSRLIQAHEAAVASTLEQVQIFVACRVTINGETSRLTTGNAVIAQFRHDLSRAADPQLHTHAVVLNATQRLDGQWRAIDNEPLYRHKMWLGAYYRCELAKEVQVLGYEVRVTHTDGRFELAHIDPAQIKTFSNRSAQIEKALEKQGLTREQASARQLQVAALQTRDGKQDHDRSDLLKQWRERAAEAGIDLQKRAAGKPALEVHANALRAEAANKAVVYAAAHLMEREAVARRLDIERAALERGTGKTDLQAIRKAIEQAVVRGDFITEGERYTTPVAQQRERDILALEVAGRGLVKPILHSQAVRLHLAETKLNNGQRAVVETVLTSSNRITGIQGSAGTGKTTVLRSVRELAETQGIKLVGVAPSAGAARELAGSGIQSQTLAALAVCNYSSLDSKTLVVLDEAGMVSASDMHALFSATSKVEARVLVVGDTQQLKAIQAGKPFAQLQVAGMPFARLTEIQRQKDPQLKEAVELAAAGTAVESLEKLRSSTVEIPAHVDRYLAIALDYTGLSPEERKGTLVVAGTNLGREAINAQVRTELGFVGQGSAFSTLSSKNLSKAEALRTVSYQAGDVVRAERDYKTLDMCRGDLAKVIDGPAGVVMLEKSDGTQAAWRPVQQPNMQVFIAYERELSLGDLIRFNENDYKAGIVNGERATVVAFEPEAQSIVLEKSDGIRLELSTSKPLHLEHGYCQTVYAAQGQTCERILIDVPASSASSNESSYYVAISRATRDVTLYTDDRDRLPQALSREDSKTTALDLPERDAHRAEREGAAMELD